MVASRNALGITDTFLQGILFMKTLLFQTPKVDFLTVTRGREALLGHLPAENKQAPSPKPALSHAALGRRRTDQEELPVPSRRSRLLSAQTSRGGKRA